MACLSCCLSAEHRYLLLLYQRTSILVAPLSKNIGTCCSSIKEYRYLLLLYQEYRYLLLLYQGTSILVAALPKNMNLAVVMLLYMLVDRSR